MSQTDEALRAAAEAIVRDKHPYRWCWACSRDVELRGGHVADCYVGTLEAALASPVPQPDREAVEARWSNGSLCVVCGNTWAGNAAHCWRVGGHLGLRCGCLAGTLDLPPQGSQHYFAVSGSPAGDARVEEEAGTPSGSANAASTAATEPDDNGHDERAHSASGTSEGDER